MGSRQGIPTTADNEDTAFRFLSSICVIDKCRYGIEQLNSPHRDRSRGTYSYNGSWKVKKDDQERLCHRFLV